MVLKATLVLISVMDAVMCVIFEDVRFEVYK